MSIEEEAAQLRADIAAAQQDQARAQHALDQAVARQDNAASAMAEEFGVAPGPETEGLLADLEAEAEAEMARVRSELAAAGPA
jgi:hypothetical protein